MPATALGTGDTAAALIEMTFSQPLGGSKCPTLAQVMITQFVGSSSASGSVLTAQSLEPALDSVSPFLSAPPLLACSLALALSQK